MILYYDIPQSRSTVIQKEIVQIITVLLLIIFNKRVKDSFLFPWGKIKHLFRDAALIGDIIVLEIPKILDA